MSPLGIATSSSTHTLRKDQGKLWILLVGVNAYQDEELPKLNYSAVDCQGLAEALVATEGRFTAKEVNIYHDFASEKPTLNNTIAGLEKIITVARPQDTILFYFSGHGILDLETNQAILCLKDTEKNNLLTTGLSLEKLLQSLTSSAAHQQLVWLDACHSGSINLMPHANPTPQFIQVLRQCASQSKGFYALLSCDRGQQSWEFPELGHGVFTHYLIRGLQGEAADIQGAIDIDTLYRYVYHRTLQYIDKTNQQLRLINQQKRGKGETELFSEYSLQTPKRIVEGVGELILGYKKSDVKKNCQRKAVIIDGLPGSKIVFPLSKLLSNVADFELQYLTCNGNANSVDFRKSIQDFLQITQIQKNKLENNKLENHQLENRSIKKNKIENNRIKNNQQLTPKQTEVGETVLLYLRGEITQSTDGEAVLLLGDRENHITLSRSWLRQQLRHSPFKQQIIILDCPEAETLQDWVEDLKLAPVQGQCLIAAASRKDNPEQFAQTLLDTLSGTSDPNGLSVAAWIAQLQISLVNSLPLHIWLSGVRGVIEIIPAIAEFSGREESQGFDLGICPYQGLRAFTENHSQYFFGREILTQQIINQLTNQSFLAVVGASGSGKSSVVRAGLIAQLRSGKQIPNSENWWVGTLRPGTKPLETLARTLEKEENSSSLDSSSLGSSSLGSSSLNSNTSISPSPSYLLLEGIQYLGVESFVYWLRSRPEPMVVLVIDQFEELFTLAADVDRQKFLELLLGTLEYAADKFKLVVTLRADFMAAGLEIPKLAPLLQESHVLVPPQMHTDDYRQVIVNPAEQVGLQVEPELVEVLLQDLQHSTGDLPLLEFVLEQLWEYRSNGKLTLSAYQKQIGGISGALEHKAQAIYDSLDPEGQACAKWIFLTLTQLGEGTEDTRRRILKSDLQAKKYSPDLVEKTLQTLTAAKLIVVNLENNGFIGGSRGTNSDNNHPENNHQENLGTHHDKNIETLHTTSLQDIKQQITVEVAHEVLIRRWSTLRWWLEENRSRLRLQRQIEQAAQLWKNNSQQPDFLLQGVRLAEAEEIYIKYTDELSGDIQEFIENCLEARRSQQLQIERRQTIVKITAGVIGILGITACIFGGLAYQQSQKIRLQEITALNSLSENFLLSDKSLEALLTSIKANKHQQQLGFVPEKLRQTSESNLSQALAHLQERNRLEAHESWVSGVSFSPNGQILASSGADRTIKLWQSNGKLIRSFIADEIATIDVSFSPDGQIIASAGADGTIKLWNLDGKLLKTFTGHKKAVNSIHFSPDSKTLISASGDRTIKIWERNGNFLKQESLKKESLKKELLKKELSKKELVKTLSGHTAGVNAAKFSPDGKTIVSASEDGTVKLWDINGKLKLLKTFTGHTDKLNNVNFSPDGKTIISASADNTIKLWNLEGQILTTITGHQGSVTNAIFTPDSRAIISVSVDKTIKLWDRDGSLIETLKGHTHEVNNLSLHPDGKTLVTVSDDHTVRLWKINNLLIRTLRGHTDEVTSVRFTQDNKQIISTSDDRTARIWNRQGKLLQTLRSPIPDITSIAFSPDGKLSVLGRINGGLEIWTSDGKTQLKTLTAHKDWVINISFSSDGKKFASAAGDGTVKIWDLNGGLLHTLKGHTGWVTQVKFSPQGDIIASAGADKIIKLWNKNGKLLKTFTGHKSSIWSLIFHPQTDIIVSAGQDQNIIFWDRNGKIIKTLKGHQGAISKISFSPDGTMLASASDDDTIKLWHYPTGHLLKTITGHSANVRGINFSPNSKILVSGSSDRTIKLWNLASIIKHSAEQQDKLLEQGCLTIKDYLDNNPNIDQEDREICK